jgi:alpha-beta hydrolase superfamily lysophospholipase
MQRIDDAALRLHFSKIMARRGADVPFDRFEQAGVENDGNRLHLDVIEVAKGRPAVVFVPGTSVYGLTFGNFLSALADARINVVSFDPRGHGRSGGLAGSFTIGEIVSDARAAIAYAKARFGGPVFIAGSSQGGIVALYTAATDADLAGAICHNAADLGDPENIRHMARPKLARLMRAAVLAIGRVAPNLPISVERYYALLSKGNAEVKARMKADPLTLKVIRPRALASLASEKMSRPIEAITTPVMMILGSEDEIFPQDRQTALFDRLNCEKQLRIYPGYGHFLVTENVDVILPVIAAWIESQSVPGGK